MALRLALLAGLALASATPPRACDYSIVYGDGTPTRDGRAETALQALPAVFVGRVNRVEVVAPDSLLRDGLLTELELGFRYRATFAVAHAWVGPTDSVSVEWESNCEVAFEVGRRYVVFAERRERTTGGSALVAPVWWDTAPLEDGHPRIDVLDAAAARLRGRGGDARPWRR